MDRVLLIVNSKAGSVSARVKEVITKALSADFDLETADTERRDHASDLAAGAVGAGFRAVVVFGGDGTINEAAQPLVGTEVALGILPGGSTNVQARTLGVPIDPVEATAFLGARLRAGRGRRIPVGDLDGRYFLASAGMGLDAEVVRRMEARPDKKQRWGEWAFASNALRAGLTEYRGAEPAIEVVVDGGDPEGAVLVVCCNMRPFTYFKRWPVDACPRATLDGGLDLLTFRRLRGWVVPRLAYSLFVSRSHVGWRDTGYHHDVRSVDLSAVRPMPVQVDGDFLGVRRSARIRLVDEGLRLVV